MREFHADDRGLWIGLFSFIVMLTVGALLYILLEPAASAVFTFALDQSNNARVTTAVERRQTIFSNILAFVLVLASISFLARAIRESDV